MAKKFYAVKEFAADERALMEAYAEGLQQGLNNAQYGCSNPEPSRVRTEAVPVTGGYAAAIQHGSWTEDGDIRWWD